MPFNEVQGLFQFFLPVAFIDEVLCGERVMVCIIMIVCGS